MANLLLEWFAAHPVLNINAKGRTVLLAGQAEITLPRDVDSALAAAHGELHRRGLSEQRWI